MPNHKRKKKKKKRYYLLMMIVKMVASLSLAGTRQCPPFKFPPQ